DDTVDTVTRHVDTRPFDGIHPIRYMMFQVREHLAPAPHCNGLAVLIHQLAFVHVRCPFWWAGHPVLAPAPIRPTDCRRSPPRPGTPHPSPTAPLECHAEFPK